MSRSSNQPLGRSSEQMPSRPLNRPSFARSAGAIARAELTLLRRNPTVFVISVFVPLAMTAGTIFVTRDAVDASGWAISLALLIALVAGMGVYMPATLALTARREDLYLKRLRTSEAGDAAIVSGVLAPLVVGGLVQCAVAVAAVVAIGGASFPALGLVAAGVLLTIPLVVLAAVATTGLVRGTEQADTATMPFFAFFVVGAIWAAYASGGDSFAHLFVPGGALVSLFQVAADGPAVVGTPAVTAMVSLAVLAVWSLACALVVRRSFRWEPRR